MNRKQKTKQNWREFERRPRWPFRFSFCFICFMTEWIEKNSGPCIKQEINDTTKERQNPFWKYENFFYSKCKKMNNQSRMMASTNNNRKEKKIMKVNFEIEKKSFRANSSCPSNQPTNQSVNQI